MKKVKDHNAYRGKGGGIHFTPNALYEQRKLQKMQNRILKEQQIESNDMKSRVTMLEQKLEQTLTYIENLLNERK